jgi:hypothetical protein
MTAESIAKARGLQSRRSLDGSLSCSRRQHAKSVDPRTQGRRM